MLLEEVWSELFLLNAVQWSLPLHATEPPTDGRPPDDLQQLADISATFREQAVDPAEFAYLKAIILFRSGEFFYFFYYLCKKKFFFYYPCTNKSVLLLPLYK